MYAVALDPGETTGVAMVRSVEDPWRIEVCQLDGEHHWDLLRLIRRCDPEVLICESFENRGQDSAILASREYIGIVKLYLQTSSATGVFQSAATGKAFWSNSKLDEHGLYVKGLQHARDAIRHYLYWRTFKVKDRSLLLTKKGTVGRLTLPIT